MANRTDHHTVVPGADFVHSRGPESIRVRPRPIGSWAPRAFRAPLGIECLAKKLPGHGKGDPRSRLLGGLSAHKRKDLPRSCQSRSPANEL